MMSLFSGKSVLVLGGSRGIGAAIVRRFADAGGKVAFTYSGSKDAAETLAVETGTEAIKADSSDAQAVAALVKGRKSLDILVINAGVYVGGDPLTLEPADVDRLIDINIRSPYYAAVAAGHVMGEGGRIIIIGSTNGTRTPHEGSAAYSMSKSAMQGLTRGLARDFGARGITVNVVQPGPVDTDMNPADGPKKAMMHEPMAIKRHATAAEVAAMVAYLASPEAGIVTGAMHNIDGGFAA
jgi:cyclic-di-GMP-binding biofilm dispersal mediator protein